MPGKWDDKYRLADVAMAEPARVLQENRHLLPARGEALDLACGLGANAILLAQQGLEVHAWDSSAVAVEKLSQWSADKQLAISTELRDVVQHPPAASSLDVIVVSHFLDRLLCPALMAALRPQGLLFYQTWTRDKVANVGPSNPDYLLEDNELLQIFQGLKIRVYREESLSGDKGKGWRDQSMLVAQRLL
ncbi:MAG: class I SAM-dependent methyltransferase [Methylophaga sp.]|nr:class I SAM-dependent methyltransferase [Methylophaga sp.]